MHLQIFEANVHFTRRYVANGSHCWVMCVVPKLKRSARGTDHASGMLGGQLFGPGGRQPLPNIGSMGGARTAGKAPSRNASAVRWSFVLCFPPRNVLSTAKGLQARGHQRRR